MFAATPGTCINMHTGIHTGFLSEKALACFYQVLPDKCPGFYNCLAHWMQRPFKYLDEHFCWIAESFEHVWKCPEMTWALFSFAHIVKCHGCFFLLYWSHWINKGPWLLLRATVTSYLFRKYWHAGNIFFPPHWIQNNWCESPQLPISGGSYWDQ